MIDHTKISKEEWLGLARSFYNHLFDEMNRVRLSEWKAATRYLGWNCKDLVNHMTSAITINFNLLIRMALDKKPVPEPGFNLFLRNASEVSHRKKSTIEETLHEFKTEIMKLMERYEAMTEEEWNTPAFFFIGDVDIRTLFLVQFADNVVHERDLMIALRRWDSFDPQYVAPLLDWFMCAFRPAFFRPDRADGISAIIQYHITGNISGDWFMKIENKECRGYRGISENADIKITTTVENLIAAALARSSPFTGKLARSLQWLTKIEKREDFTAFITGSVAGISSLIRKKIIVEGDKKKAALMMKKMFWHFWERTEQTQENISKSKYKSLKLDAGSFNISRKVTLIR